MRVPLEPGAVEEGDAADGDLAQVGGRRGLGAHGAEEAVPAAGDGGRVQQREVEGDQAARAAAGLHRFEGFLLFWGGEVRRVVGVWDAHRGGAGFEFWLVLVCVRGLLLRVGQESARLSWRCC